MAHEAMKKLFKQIPTMKSKPPSHDKKRPVDIDKYWLCMLLDTLGRLRLFFCSSENTDIFTGEG